MTRIEEALMRDQFKSVWERMLWHIVGISFRKPENHPEYNLFLNLIEKQREEKPCE